MRLIDGNRLLNLARSERDTCGKDYDFDGLLSDIENAPTVEAAPVRHGRWINMKNGNANCSVCGRHVVGVYDDDNADKYCRHCGSRMDLEEQDAKEET